ncbi:MAG: NAD+ synthase [Ignavibacteria bacterium]|nr:NAD+ synthase [Ignavibacteria bacterium]
MSQSVVDVLADFIYNEVTKTGFNKVVIGLSGGIDSTVSAYLAARALGHRNVIGILLPYKSSSPDSIKHALLVTEKLKIKSVIINITKAVDSLIETDPEIEKNKVRKGNIIARMRMVSLYDQSAKHKALVLGTGNKTEILLGYTTLYGDSAYAINPIGDLYKTQVWKLAEYLGCPEEIINKKPSADLWKGQTDEGELGFTYKEVDRLLYYMVDQRYSDNELTELGFRPSFIRRIRKLIQKNQFKRVPPLIAKISNRTVNIDFRYNRDWGM